MKSFLFRQRMLLAVLLGAMVMIVRLSGIRAHQRREFEFDNTRLYAQEPFPLHAAAYVGNKAAIEGFLRVNPRGLVDRDQDGLTPLHSAALAGSPETIEYLLSRGADPRAVDRYGNTPAHISCALGTFHATATRRLVAAAGGDAGRTVDGRTVDELWRAADAHYRDMGIILKE